MKKVAYSLFPFAFSILSAFAAKIPATIITASGETMQVTVDLANGESKYRSLQENIEYYDAGGSKHSLKAEEVKEITVGTGADAVTLVSIPYKYTGLENANAPDKGNILAQQIVDGKVSVYKFWYTEPGVQFAPSVTEKYLLRKEGDEFYEPAYFSFRKDMEGYLCDCPTLIDKLENGQFKRKQLPLLIAEYNETCGY
jgi:hypothetical protein